MKTGMIVGLLLAAQVAGASGKKEMSVRATDLSCEDFQQLLLEKRALNVVSGRFGWGVVHKYYASDCGLYFASPSRVRTADTWSCFSGFVCLKY